MQELFPSAWEIKAEHPGPTFLIIGGLHGNEKTGIQIVKNLKVKFEAGDLKLLKGRLLLALGNLKAIELGERGSKPLSDLNRAFHLDLEDRKPDGTYEDERARQIAPLMKETDVLIDLHATNKPSEPFLACFGTPDYQEVYQYLLCKKVLADPLFIIGGGPTTSTDYVDHYAGLGVAFETGQANDTSRIPEVQTQVENVLKHFGMLSGDILGETRTDQDVYETTEAITLTEKDFEYADGFGKGSWQPFKAGDTLGHHGTEPLIPDYSGVIVFPKMKEHRTLGKPVGYLAKKIS
jgi:succinylglutamate desuccinylase